MAGAGRAFGVAAVVAAAAACLFFRLGAPALYDPHESAYAATAREMHRAGDWITPRLEGAPNYDKPPLYFWLARVSFAALGETPLAARLPNALAAAANVALAAAIAGRLFGFRAGVAAGLVLATSFGTVVFARQLMLEELLCATQALSIFALLSAREAAARVAGGDAAALAAAAAWGALAGAGAGLAVLTKGLLGLVFPGAVALVLVAGAGGLTRRALVRAGAVAGLLLVVVALPWHVAAQARHDGFAARYLLEEQVLRFFDARPHRDYRPVSLAAFIGFAALWALPWTPFLPEALAARDRAARPVRAWALAVIGFFALTPARLEYYSLPALTPMAILVGRRLAWRGPSAAAAAALAIAGWAGAEVAPRLLERWGQVLPHPSVPDIARACVLALAAGGTAALALRLVGARRASIAPIVASGAVLAVLVARGFELYAPARSSEALAAAVAARARPGDELVLDAPGEWEEVGGLVWYLGAAGPAAPRPLVANDGAALRGRHFEGPPLAIAESALEARIAASLAARADGPGPPRPRLFLATRRPERYPGLRAVARVGGRTLLLGGAEP